MDALDPLTFDCPRCGTSTEAAFYGPCDRCVATLRTEVTAVARAVEDAAYEPKVNVTPNAVALKE